MNRILLYALLGLSHSQDPGDLIDWLPANTQSVVILNDVQRAAKGYPSPEYQRSVNSFQERFAITPEELAELVEGQVLRAELIGQDGELSEVVIAHASSNTQVAVARLHQRLKRQNATVHNASFGSVAGDVVARKMADGTERISVHLLHEGRLLLADRRAAANEIVAHLRDVDRRGLSKQEGFVQVWEKCRPALLSEELAIAWYSDPWMRLRLLKVAAERTAEGDPYRFAQRHGMDGIVAVGGSVVIGAEGGQAVEAFADAPQPLAKSLRMGAYLTGNNQLTLPEWVSRAATDVVVLHGDVGKALEHAGLLFDDGFADGVEGTYDDVLRDLQDLLELDIKKDLYPLLGPRLYLINGIVADRAWQPLVVALEVKNAQRVAEILQILIADDPEAIEVVLASKSDRLWHVPGKRGGRDFVLGMLKGQAIYANDFEFTKKAMRFDDSTALVAADQFQLMQERAAGGSAAQPSILIVRNPNSRESAAQVHPLDLVFQGAGFFAEREGQVANSLPWLPRRLGVLLAPHQLVVGFREEDGWKFVARTDGETPGGSNDP